MQEKVSRLRIALIFYRDYGEMFLTKVYDFNPDINYTDYLVRQIKIDGGEDIPEAVYEAIVELNGLHQEDKPRLRMVYSACFSSRSKSAPWIHSQTREVLPIWLFCLNSYTQYILEMNVISWKYLALNEICRLSTPAETGTGLLD